MRPIQILMDEKQLEALDREATRLGLDRSKLMREAVRRFLVKLVREKHEARYLESYRRKPQQAREVREWSKVQAWPAD